MGCENPRLSTSLLLAILLCCSLAGFSQVTLTASSGTGSGSFTTLKDAFDAINAGTHQGAIVININASTSETASAVLNASDSGSASYTAISIYPTTTGLSISGDLAAPLIDLDGADNVIIDGRVNATGSTKSLTISNTSTSSNAGTSTIRYIKDASSNTVKYCTLKGSSTVAAAGIVFFSTGTTTGNDNNTIDNNNITNANANRPINAVYALGTVGNNNETNTISNNNVYNFLRTGTASNGINIRDNNSAFTISGNSFYETASFAATASVAYNVILISAASGDGNGFTVSGNYIGGRSAQCGGSAWTKTGFNNTFNAISVTTATGTANEIQGNTIRSIKWTNTGNANFTGISLSGVTVANIGTTTGNIVGSINDTANAANANFYGINISTSGEVDCRNNTISSIITAATSHNHNNNFYGIFKSSSDGTTTISGNTIGSTTTSNSIIATSLSSSNPQLVYGILSSGTDTVTISGNTVANLNNTTRNRTTSTTGLVNGISVSAGTNTISNNTVRNLTINNANSSISHTASVSGIVMTSTTAAAQTVSGNTVSNLSNSFDDTPFTGGVIGIYYAGPTTASTVSQNFIHSLSVTGASSIAADLYGIKINSGATTYSNNIISILGGTKRTDIFGIFETGTANNNNSFYFNTVYISGSMASGATNKSYALYSAVNTNTRDFRNNVLVNARSTVGGSSLHYALFAVSGGTITCDYNNYYVSGTGGAPGYYGADMASLPIVTGQDANSIATNPVFFSTGTAASGFAPTVPGTGVTTTGITTDYAGNTRGTPASMGALQVTSWSGGASTDWATTSNWTSGAIPDAGSIVIIPSSLTNYPAVPSDRTLTSLSLASGASLNLSSNTLTLTSNLSNAGSISGDGKLTMGGSSAQTISGTGTVSNLEVNNSAGVTITSGAGNLQSITGVLTPTAGTLTTNGNLTLKSSASGTARVAAVPASGAAISGNVTVERYLPPGRKWRFLTAPLKGSSNNSVYRNWQNNGTPSGATGLDVWGAGGTATPSTGTNGLQIGPSASMRRYGVGGTGGWTDVTDTKSATGATLFDGTTNNAFSVFVKGPFNDGNTAVNEGGAAVATTLSATGTLITGTHTKTLSANPTAGQYFLVGNPYASAVNPALLSGTNLANTFWMWDATTSGGSGAGSYVAFNRSPGTYNVSTGGFGNSPLTHIQSGQAFFARASAAGTNTTITFEEADKSTATGGGMFGPQQVPDEYGTLRLTLSQTTGSDQPRNLDGAVAFFYANGNPKVDGMDGGKLLNGSENLFFRREGRSLTFEHRATVETMDTLFVRMGNLQKTSYRLTAEGAGLGKGVECKLLDRLTGKETSMTADGIQSYDFTVTDDSLSTGDRFMVLFSKPSTLTVPPDASAGGAGLRLYPNPVRARLRVSMGVGSAGPAMLQIFDAKGVEVMRRKVSAAGSVSADVDVSLMKGGLYTLLLTDGQGGKSVGKFVKE